MRPAEVVVQALQASFGAHGSGAFSLVEHRKALGINTGGSCCCMGTRYQVAAVKPFLSGGAFQYTPRSHACHISLVQNSQVL